MTLPVPLSSSSVWRRCEASPDFSLRAYTPLMQLWSFRGRFAWGNTPRFGRIRMFRSGLKSEAGHEPALFLPSPLGVSTTVGFSAVILRRCRASRRHCTLIFANLSEEVCMHSCQQNRFGRERLRRKRKRRRLLKDWEIYPLMKEE